MGSRDYKDVFLMLGNVNSFTIRVLRYSIERHSTAETTNASLARSGASEAQCRLPNLISGCWLDSCNIQPLAGRLIHHTAIPSTEYQRISLSLLASNVDL